MSTTEDKHQAIEIYRSDSGDIELKVRLDGDTVWLSQSQMALLFGRDRTVITRYINNCYKEGELDRNLTCAKFAQVRTDGSKRIADATLVALTLMIAESRLEEKDMMVRVVVNLINKQCA